MATVRICSSLGVRNNRDAVNGVVAHTQCLVVGVFILYAYQSLRMSDEYFGIVTVGYRSYPGWGRSSRG